MDRISWIKLRPSYVSLKVPESHFLRTSPSFSIFYDSFRRVTYGLQVVVGEGTSRRAFWAQPSLFRTSRRGVTKPASCCQFSAWGASAAMAVFSTWRHAIKEKRSKTRASPSRESTLARKQRPCFSRFDAAVFSYGGATFCRQVFDYSNISQLFHRARAINTAGAKNRPAGDRAPRAHRENFHANRCAPPPRAQWTNERTNDRSIGRARFRIDMQSGLESMRRPIGGNRAATRAGIARESALLCEPGKMIFTPGCRLNTRETLKPARGRFNGSPLFRR